MSREIYHQPRVLRAPSNLALNPAREGASKTDENLVNFCVLSSGKEDKEVKIQPLPSPGCC